MSELVEQEEQEEQELITLTRRVGPLSPELQSRVEALPLAQLENLGEALLEFGTVADLETWLESQDESLVD